MVMTWSAMTWSALCTVCTGCEHRPSIQRSEERWEHHGTHTPHFYLKVSGEVGTPWYTHTGLLSKGQRRGGNTVVQAHRTSM